MWRRSLKAVSAGMETARVNVQLINAANDAHLWGRMGASAGGWLASV